VPVPQSTKKRFRFRSLETRIVTLFLVLALSIQLAGFFLIRASIDQNARALISDELVLGERVFRRLLEQNAAGKGLWIPVCHRQR
jgi:hypothetical protein